MHAAIIESGVAVSIEVLVFMAVCLCVFVYAGYVEGGGRFWFSNKQFWRPCQPE
jgi:hypothetical protein